MKKEILESFQSDYKKAIAEYNNGEYKFFFRDIRPAIELFCKLAVYDILGDDELADEIISGRKSIVKDRYEEAFIISDERRKISGSGYVMPFKLSYYYKHPQVAFSRGNGGEERVIKRDIESCAENLVKFYGIASEIGNHTGDTSLNEKVQADSCRTAFPAIFDSFSSNSILSKNTLDFLKGLENDARPASLNKIEEDGIRLQEAENLARKLQDEKNELKRVLEETTKAKDEQQKLYENLLEQIKHSGAETVQDESGEEPPLTFKPKVSESTSMDWNVEENRLDGDQTDLIEETIDKSMLVAGCAGSGKSVIAVHKAEQIAQSGGDVILIAYTKSLASYMTAGGARLNGYRFYYHYQWVKQGMPSADYIIVDEIQDFDKEEIESFIGAAKKHYFFFGDTAQSIYRLFGKKTMTIEEISQMTGLDILLLYNNYRLPKSIAKITQDYVGVNVEPYKEKIYKSDEVELPHFVHVENDDNQIESIIDVIKNNENLSVGILLLSNESVLKVYSAIRNQIKSVELKYEGKQSGGIRGINTLNFTTKNPKVMTYHSAKGLQFDIVIIPMFTGAADEEARKALYVAMTRTMHKLYIFYSAPSLAFPLSKVPRRLYLDK